MSSPNLAIATPSTPKLRQSMPNTSSPNRKQIPYVVYKNLSDFVVDGKLPAQAKVAIVGDWGTGQDAAKLVLRQIANKKPDVVIHLGDIYYAGTQFEVDNYFLQPWKQILNLARLIQFPTFSLAGNHDMYSGGVPYYQMIQTELGQPASYFCLRNANWQFVGLDTGYHDHNPAGGGSGRDLPAGYRGRLAHRQGEQCRRPQHRSAVTPSAFHRVRQHRQQRSQPAALSASRAVAAQVGAVDLGPRARLCALRRL